MKVCEENNKITAERDELRAQLATACGLLMRTDEDGAACDLAIAAITVRRAETGAANV